MEILRWDIALKITFKIKWENDNRYDYKVKFELKIQNYDWHLRRWFLYHFLKLPIESRFKFVGTASHNLEATYTKVNPPALVLTFSRWKLPLEAYLVLYLWKLETVLRESWNSKGILEDFLNILCASKQ